MFIIFGDTQMCLHSTYTRIRKHSSKSFDLSLCSSAQTSKWSEAKPETLEEKNGFNAFVWSNRARARPSLPFKTARSAIGHF